MAKEPIEEQLLWKSESDDVTIGYVYKNREGSALDLYIRNYTWHMQRNEWYHYVLGPRREPNLWWDCDTTSYIGLEAP